MWHRQRHSAALEEQTLSHYQKLATLLLRLVAIMVLVIGVAGLILYLTTPVLEPGRNARMHSSIAFIMLGIIGCIVSPALGRLAGKGL